MINERRRKIRTLFKSIKNFILPTKNVVLFINDKKRKARKEKERMIDRDISHFRKMDRFEISYL